MKIFKYMNEAAIRYAKRKYHLFLRNRENNIHPIKITLKELRKKEAFYNEIVSMLVNEMRQKQREIVAYNPAKTVQFSDYEILSYNGDLMGKVFLKDGNIYRGIYAESVKTFLELWNTGLLQILGKYEYIPKTTISDYYTEDYPVILKHEIVDMSASKLWNYEMIKDASICMCIIQKVCNEMGFKLHDGHLNNMTFHKGKPVFTDIGSIVKNDGDTEGQKTGLVFAACYRLLCWDLGNSILKRIQAYDEDNNALWISPMSYTEDVIELRALYKKYRRYHLRHSSLLCNWVIFKVFRWKDVRPEYIDVLFQWKQTEPGDYWIYSEDIKAINEILERNQYHYDKVIDIGGTAGMLPVSLYQKKRIKVISIENTDKKSVAAYNMIKSNKLPINTYVYNYLYGADIHTRKHLLSDMAIAIDITQNHQCYQTWKIDSLVNSLSKLTRKYVIVTVHYNQGSSAVSNEEFKKNFEQFFEILCCLNMGDTIENGFVLYVGKLKISNCQAV